jgi:hypothetical protein
VAVALGLLIVNYFQMRSTETAAQGAADAASTAAKQLEMSERPWVVEDFTVSGPLLFMPNGNATITIQSNIRNIGHSVAIDVEDHIAGFPAERGNFDRAISEQKGMCDRMRERPVIPGGSSGAIMFPGAEPDKAENTLTFTKEEIHKAQIRGNGIAPDIVSFVVYGCVNYGFVFSKEHHQTGFAYEIVRPSGQQIGTLPIQVGVNLLPSQLTIRRYLFGRFYVD